MKRLTLLILSAFLLISSGRAAPAIAFNIHGSARFSTNEGSSWKTLRASRSLDPKIVINTGPAAYADIWFRDGSLIRIPAESEVAIDEIKVEGDFAIVELDVRKGRLIAIAKSSNPASRLEVKTRAGACGARASDQSAAAFEASADGIYQCVSPDLIVVHMICLSPPDVLNAGESTSLPPRADGPEKVKIPKAKLEALEQEIAALKKSWQTAAPKI